MFDLGLRARAYHNCWVSAHVEILSLLFHMYEISNSFAESPDLFVSYVAGFKTHFVRFSFGKIRGEAGRSYVC